MLLVALSATMRNVQDIRDWFVAVHGPTGHALLYIYIYIYKALVCGSSPYTASQVMRYFLSYIYIYSAGLRGEVAIEGGKKKKEMEQTSSPPTTGLCPPVAF